MKSNRLMIRMEEETRKEIERRATEQGLNASTWARMILMKEIMKGDE